MVGKKKKKNKHVFGKGTVTTITSLRAVNETGDKWTENGFTVRTAEPQQITYIK